MATGSLSVTVTVPVTNANDPNAVGRQIAVTALALVSQAIGANAQTSGNIVYPPGSTTVIGTYSFTPGT